MGSMGFGLPGTDSNRETLEERATIWDTGSWHAKSAVLCRSEGKIKAHPT